MARGEQESEEPEAHDDNEELARQLMKEQIELGMLRVSPEHGRHVR